MDVSEIRSEELTVQQLAIALIYAIEVLEECKGKVLEARFTNVDKEDAEEVAELPVVTLRSFLAETLKPRVTPWVMTSCPWKSNQMRPRESFSVFVEMDMFT
jgi:hypothetical protein